MALIAQGEWLMVGFGTDFEARVHFSPSVISAVDKTTALFCTTLYKSSDVLTPIIN